MRATQPSTASTTPAAKTLPTTAWKASGERSATALWRFMRLSGVQTRGEDAIVPARVDELPGSFQTQTLYRAAMRLTRFDVRSDGLPDTLAALDSPAQGARARGAAKVNPVPASGQ